MKDSLIFSRIRLMYKDNMPKYTTRKERRSRLEQIEAKRTNRQTIILFIVTLLSVLLVIFVGIPGMIKLAIFLGDVREIPGQNSQSDVPPTPPVVSAIPSATNSAQLKISGFSQPGNTIILYQNNTKTDTTTSDKDGAFEFPLVRLGEGQNYLYTQAINNQKLESARSKTQSIQLLTKPPEITITSPKDNQQFFTSTQQRQTIIGSVTNKSTLTINGQIAVTNNQGEFSFAIFLKEGDNLIELIATDDAGNQTTKSIKLTFQP